MKNVFSFFRARENKVGGSATIGHVVGRSPKDLGVNVYIDTCSKFHRALTIKGWLSHTSGRQPKIVAVAVYGHGVEAANWEFLSQMAHLGPHAGGFEVHCLLKNIEFPSDIRVVLTLDGVGSICLGRDMLSKRGAQVDLGVRFRALLAESGAKRMLDIGGRARSGVLRAKGYPGIETEVLDIHPGEGVTIVCDAHKMSEVLPADHFDAVVSVSVFEHLVMPWKVALEMNKVMKRGAYAMIHTHQTIGMHDMPWDYFRFSDSAWSGIFNRSTGFEVIETQLSDLNYITPFFWTESHEGHERSAGFESSAVIVKKIGGTALSWPLGAADVTDDFYPPGEHDKPKEYKHV